MLILGGRFVITGTQLGILLALTTNKVALKELKKIAETQYIGTEEVMEAIEKIKRGT